MGYRGDSDSWYSGYMEGKKDANCLLIDLDEETRKKDAKERIANRLVNDREFCAGYVVGFKHTLEDAGTQAKRQEANVTEALSRKARRQHELEVAFGGGHVPLEDEYDPYNSYFQGVLW